MRGEKGLSNMTSTDKTGQYTKIQGKMRQKLKKVTWHSPQAAGAAYNPGEAMSFSFFDERRNA